MKIEILRTAVDKDFVRSVLLLKEMCLRAVLIPESLIKGTSNPQRTWREQWPLRKS